MIQITLAMPSPAGRIAVVPLAIVRARLHHGCGVTNAPEEFVRVGGELAQLCYTVL